jgi:multiple sugar transport system ATP-binding protein
MNLYEAAISEGARGITIGSQEIPIDDSIRTAHPKLAAYAGKPVVIGVRPESLPAANGNTAAPLIADIVLVEALGSELQVHFTIDAKRIQAEGPSEENELSTSGAGVARVGPRVPAKPGDKIRFDVDTSAIHFFDPDTDAAIWS